MDGYQSMLNTTTKTGVGTFVSAMQALRSRLPSERLWSRARLGIAGRLVISFSAVAVLAVVANLLSASAYAAAFGLLGVTGLLAPAARANSLRVGQPAPPATLVTLDGKRLATSDFLGRVFSQRGPVAARNGSSRSRSRCERGR